MTRSGYALALAGLMTLVACGSESHGPDASTDETDGAIDPIDAATDATIDAAIDAAIDAPDCTTGRTAGCGCSDPGYTECWSGMGIQCCGGTWHEFFDGPCWSAGLDAGAPTCETPDIGCPCPTEGATQCRSFQWSLVCSDGAWRAQVGRVCC